MNSFLTNSQTAKITLWYQVNTSLSAYTKLIKAFFNAENALKASGSEWQQLKLHAKHIQRHRDTDSTQKFLIQINTDLQQNKYQLVFQGEDDYPQQLNELFDPPPLLFVRGNIKRLQEAQIAIVGSRKPTPHAQKITFDMAQYLAQAGYIITSGLAQGVDYHAHMGALTQPTDQNLLQNVQTEVQTYVPTNIGIDNLHQGRTIGVMGTGIDVCYPKNHSTLFHQIVAAGGCLISELLPQTPANKHTFPRRNRIVAGLSLGTIVTEATIQSGSLITARLTSEQGKQVFAIPSHIDNKNAEGCHHLIREGATLIYHPQQVLDDIKYQQIQPSLVFKEPLLESNVQPLHDTVIETTSIIDVSNEDSKDESKKVVISTLPKSMPAALPLANTELSPALTKLFAQIDWTGVDIDRLVSILRLDIQTLLVQLMELELIGLIRQEGGCYVRV